ncbi:MAG: PfkB family carbohydrate kinase [Actinomycetota bacterium]
MRPPVPGLTALSFGESVIDIYPDRRVVAGSPLHLAAHLAHRGWGVTLATRLGADPDAAEIRDVLRRYSISQAAVESDPLLPTGSVSVRLHNGGHSFHIHRPASWDALELRRIPAADVVCYGSLIGRATVARAALFRLLDEGDFAMRVFDVNLRPPDVHLETIGRCLRAATVVKVGDEELAELARLLKASADPVSLFGYAPDLQWVAVTRGAQGASLWHRSGETWSQPARPVKIVDAVGAGDAFAGGLVDALGRNRPGAEALANAIGAAESILGQRGGLPPTDDRGDDRAET